MCPKIGYHNDIKEIIMAGLGTTEIILIVAVLFLLFGATRLPQLAKSIGQSRKAFKEGMREAEEESTPAPAPQITQNRASTLSDDEIAAELKRRSEARTS